MTHSSTRTSDPRELFDSLQAERETDWLHDVFVPSAEFSTFVGARSVVIFGDGGSGKTALRLMLSRYAAGTGTTAQRLVVPWRPAPRLDLSGTPAAHALFTQALGACARELLRLAGRHPERWRNTPPWVTETNRWLIHTFVPEIQRAPDHYLSRLAEEATSEGSALQAELVAGPPQPLFEPDIDDEQLVGELAGVARRLDYEGVWVMVDGLERLTEQAPEALSTALSALFSTLAIFQHPNMTIKMVAPTVLAPAIKVSGGVVTRRIDVHDLRWSAPELERIVTRRLALALDRPEFDLSDIYSRSTVIGWLIDNGGTLPRLWLDLGRHLLEMYQAQGNGRPLLDSMWHRLARERPRSLRVDLVAGRVFVDEQEVSDISPASFKLLSYLYLNRGQICTRSELYYRALRDFSEEPRSFEDTGYEDPKDYAGVLDSLLWRLRYEIEPDPKRPIFLRIVRGRGVRLEQTV